MSFKYILGPNAGDSHQSSPHWLAVIVRFADRDTYNDQALGENGQPVSKETSMKNPVAEMAPLILDSEIMSWNVSSGKKPHTGTGVFTLPNTGIDYTSEVCPGDWILFWAFDNRKDYEWVRGKIERRQRCNEFDDGFKFMGRVNGVRRKRSLGGNGAKTTGYTITAVSFSEFDNTIYYNESMQARYGGNMLQFAIDFGGEINNFLLNGEAGGSILAGDAIKKLLNVCLGLGPGAASKGINPLAIGDNADLRQAASVLQASPNSSNFVPATIGELVLGRKTSQTKPELTYVDLMRAWIGTQRYQQTILETGDEVDAGLRLTSIKGFVPDVGDGSLPGEFLPHPVDFNQKSVWSILGTYLNEPVNEMYTCMRVDHEGKVMPTLIARQTPFSSNSFQNVRSSAPVTTFTSLPRWVLDDRIVIDDDVGSSNSTRFNFIFLPAQDQALAGQSAFLNQNQNYVVNPPMVDTADIQRNGLRMFAQTLGARVNASLGAIDQSPGRFWTKLMADVCFNQHLRWSGNIVSMGIQVPICEGDNVQYDGVIYHIERVTHQGGIDQFSGKKSFYTSLSVSSGVSTETDNDPAGRNVYPVKTFGSKFVANPDPQARGTNAEDRRLHSAITFSKR